jgi:hypothetical protein
MQQFTLSYNGSPATAHPLLQQLTLFCCNSLTFVRAAGVMALFKTANCDYLEIMQISMDITDRGLVRSEARHRPYTGAEHCGRASADCDRSL